MEIPAPRRAPARSVLWLIAAAAVTALVTRTVIQAPDTSEVDIESIVREAEHLAHVEGFEPARTSLEAALRTARSRADPRLEALCLDRIGLVLHFEGRSRAGEELQQRALALGRRIPDERLAASILASTGLSHWRHARYVEARDALREALAIQERAGDAAGSARTRLFLGRVHFKNADYMHARAEYQQVVAMAGALPDGRWLSIAFEDLGDLALEQGFFVEALDSFERALAIRRREGDAAGEAYALHLVGKAYLLQAAYREALGWFERAAAVARRHDSRPALGLAFYHIGIARNGLGDSAGALEAYATGLALKQEMGDRRQEAWILRRMGDAHLAQRNARSALDHYERAIRIWEDIGDPRGLAGGLSRAAQLNFDLHRYEASIDAYRRAERLLVAGQPAFVGPALAGIGRAYAAAGDRPRALEYGRRAAEIGRQGPDDVRWATARSLGWIERRLGHRERALASYAESLGVIEALRGRTVPAADVRADFLEGKQTVYSEAVDLLFEAGRVEQAFEVAERSRTRAFLDMLHEKNLGGRSTTAPLTLGGARREAIRTGGAILEYFSADDRLFMWVLDRDGRVHAASAPTSRQELADAVAALRRAMAADVPVDSRPLLRRLHDMLIEPVARWLPAERDRPVTIVPHGPLFLISFAALLDRRGTYLVERHTLVYSPSVSVLPYTHVNGARARRSAGAPLLIVGNPAMPRLAGGAEILPPLPGAEREVREIGALYPPARTHVLTGADASERAVRRLAPAVSAIHLATHASIIDHAPMRSYLALAPDPPHDGFLSVADVFTLDLRASLVTLSACDTGLGHVSGEGVVGLSRAFIYAGAASVLVSLWRVADAVATTEMHLFYAEVLRTDGDKASALAHAQRRMIAILRAGEVEAAGARLPEDPLFWAAFVLVGEAS